MFYISRPEHPIRTVLQSAFPIQKAESDAASTLDRQALLIQVWLIHESRQVLQRYPTYEYIQRQENPQPQQQTVVSRATRLSLEIVQFQERYHLWRRIPCQTDPASRTSL